MNCGERCKVTAARKGRRRSVSCLFLRFPELSSFLLKVANEAPPACAQRFTLLRVDVSREDEDPALGAIKRKYGTDTLPAIRILSSDGAVVAKTDTLVSPDEFLALLSRAAP